jgi:ribosomal protein L21
MTYAIIQASGKQILVKPNKWYDLGFIKTGKVGDYIYLNKILLFKINNQIQLGKPFLENSKISAKIIQ